jgi:hypothetical protein
LIRRTAATLALALLGVGWSPTIASAAESASIQAVLTQDGGGRMTANSQTNPSDETWAWEACSIDLTTCTPFASGRSVETTGAPVPSVFRATSSHGATALSPQWSGRVESASPPSTLGKPRANELVVPVPGHWSGGWSEDVDWTQLAACRGRDDEGCTTLTNRHYLGGCANGGAIIDPAFTGMSLRVADQRIPAHTPEPAYAVSSPYGPNIWLPGPTVSVAIVGRIQAAANPPASGCGPSPLVEASISNQGVATILCHLDCHATLVARQGKHKAHASRKLPALPPKRTLPRLHLNQAQWRRFEPGPVHMVVKVNGRRIASRTVQFQ